MELCTDKRINGLMDKQTRGRWTVELNYQAGKEIDQFAKANGSQEGERQLRD
jgi:hypothetical protein